MTVEVLLQYLCFTGNCVKFKKRFRNGTNFHKYKRTTLLPDEIRLRRSFNYYCFSENTNVLLTYNPKKVKPLLKPYPRAISHYTPPLTMIQKPK